MSHVANGHEHHDSGAKAIYGFWVFLLTDLIMFSALFASYAVLRNNTFGSIGIQQVASLSYVFVMTVILIASSFVLGLSLVACKAGSKGLTMFWLLVAFVLTIAFLCMEQHEFAYLIHSGNDWTRSAFLSVFFTLQGMHGFHVLCGLLWIAVLFVQLSYRGTSAVMKTRVACLSMFFHFLNLLWILIFVIVYLMGAV